MSSQVVTHHAAESLLAAGAIIAHWDDDDWYAPSRLTRFEVILGNMCSHDSSPSLVEEAFRSLKTVQLEVRPVYHKTDCEHDSRGGDQIAKRRKGGTSHPDSRRSLEIATR